MPDFFWIAFGATLTAHAVALMSLWMFMSYVAGEPKRYAAVRLFDKVLNIGVRGTGFLLGLIIFGAAAYVFYLLALDTLRIWGLRD